MSNVLSGMFDIRITLLDSTFTNKILIPDFEPKDDLLDYILYISLTYSAWSQE